MSSCELLAEVFIGGMANPATPVYLCTYSGVNPLVCKASYGYTALLQDPAFREVNKELISRGCSVAVQAGQKVTRIVVAKGARTVNDVQRAARHSRKVLHALNTPQGISWLMQYLRTH